MLPQPEWEPPAPRRAGWAPAGQPPAARPPPAVARLARRARAASPVRQGGVLRPAQRQPRASGTPSATRSASSSWRTATPASPGASTSSVGRQPRGSSWRTPTARPARPRRGSRRPSPISGRQERRHRPHHVRRQRHELSGLEAGVRARRPPEREGLSGSLPASMEWPSCQGHTCARSHEAGSSRPSDGMRAQQRGSDELSRIEYSRS